MASEVIGNFSVKLTASAAGLVTGLEAAATRIKSFSAMAITAAKATGAAVNAALASITKIDLGAQTSQITGLVSSVAGIAGAVALGPAAVAAAIGAAGVATVAFAHSSADAVAQQVALGRQIGLTAQQAAGLQILASRQGINGDALQGGIVLWARQLGKLREELNSNAGGPITRALQSWNINAREFNGLGIEEQFARIAEAAARVPESAEKMSTLQAIISNRAAAMAPLFRNQASELRGLNGVAGEFGYSLSQSEALGIAETVKSLKKLGAYISSWIGNMGQSMALVFAPAAQAAGDTLKMLFDRAKPVLNLIMRMGTAVALGPYIALIYGISKAIQFVMPWLEAGGRIIDTVMTSVGTVITAVSPIVEDSIARMKFALGTLFGEGGFEGLMSVVLPVVATFATGIAMAFAGVVIVIARVVSALATVVHAVGNASQAVTGFLGRMSARTVVALGLTGFLPTPPAPTPPPSPANEVRDVVARSEASYQAGLDAKRRVQALMEETEVLRVGADVRERQLLIERGITAGELATFDRMVSLNRQLRERVAMTEQIRDLQNAAPGQSFANQVQQFQGLAAFGGPEGLDAAAGGLGRAVQQLLASAPNRESRAPEAVLAGTVAEQRAIAQAQRQERDAQRDPVDLVRQEMVRLNTLAARQNEIGLRMLQALEDGQFETVGD